MLQTPNSTNKAPASFSWARVIVETRLTGLSAMIACQCEPVHYNASIPSLQLELPSPVCGLHNTPAMIELTSVLKDYFGTDLDLQFTAGPALHSPLTLATARKTSGFAKAHETVMSDEIVNAMLEKFGGKILTETVRPIALTEPTKAAGASKP